MPWIARCTIGALWGFCVGLMETAYHWPQGIVSYLVAGLGAAAIVIVLELIIWYRRR